MEYRKSSVEMTFWTMTYENTLYKFNASAKLDFLVNLHKLNKLDQLMRRLSEAVDVSSELYY